MRSTGLGIAATGFKAGEGGIYLVSQLNDLKLRIEEKINADGLDAAAVKGKIGLKAGKVLAFINASTPDDPEVIGKLKAAAKEILNLNL
jgi:hypothetical protein